MCGSDAVQVSKIGLDKERSDDINENDFNYDLNHCHVFSNLNNYLVTLINKTL